MASAFGLYKYSIQGVTEWPDYSATLLGFNSLSIPSLVTYVGCLAHKIRSDKTLFPSRLIDLLQICLKPRFQTTLLLNAAVLFCRVVVCLCRFCFYWKDEGVPTSTKGLNKDWVDGNWFCKATVCLLLIFSEKKKEHCVPAAIFCLVIGDKSQIRRCAIPRFNFGWQLRCQFQLFPRMPLPDTKGKQVSPFFQAVIVISLKPLNHFLCHIIVKASVSFKTKCRTASPCCRCVRQFCNFPENHAIRRPLQSLLGQVWRRVRVEKRLKFPPLYSFIHYSCDNFGQYFCLSVYNGERPRSLHHHHLYNLSRLDHKDMLMTQKFGEIEHGDTERQPGGGCWDVFFALPFITHLPLDMVRRHRFVFQAYWTLCRSINSQIGPQIASLCTPTEEWTGYCSWQMFYNIPCFCVFYHILVRSLSVFRFAPICCVNLTVAVVGC